MFYWRIFNLCLKGVGVAFVLGGILSLAYFVPILLDSQATINVNGVPTTSFLYKLAAVGMASLFAIAGVVLIRVKPYYPSKLREKAGN